MIRLAQLWMCIACLEIALANVEQVTVTLSNRPFRQLREDYVSLGLDSILIRRNWCDIDWNRAIALGRQLKSTQLRFGGNDADRMWFEDAQAVDNEILSANESCIPTPNTKNFSISREQFDRLNWFASSVGWRLIFDLNALFRNADGRYNTSNAVKLLNYAAAMNYSMDFELGNEPNSFFHKFGVRVNGTQLAADYVTLRQLLSRYPSFANSRLIGPSITQLDKRSKIKYLNEFLKADGYKSVEALTWHHYYINGRTATLDQFLNSTILDTLAVQMRTAQRCTRHYTHQKDFPIWLGETASAFGGGAPGLSDTYAAGFMWLDKLGMGALNGMDVVVRQSFFNGYYGLINQQSLPNPDYWLTLLFKRLVGARVLKVATTPLDSHVRIYAHCDPRRITVFAMNLKTDDVDLRFAAYTGAVEVYEYAPLSGNLTDSLITINGRAPSFAGSTVRLRLKAVKKQQPILLKSFRVLFIVLPLNDVMCAL